MHLTETPDNASGVCLLTGTSSDPLGFVNTELPTDAKRLGNPAVVSATYVRQLAETIGMVTPADLAYAHEQNKELEVSLSIAENERDQYKMEAEALMLLVGPKLWGKAQHIRKAAGFQGRRRADAIKKYAEDNMTEDEFQEAMWPSTDS